MNDPRYPSRSNEFLLYLNVILLICTIGFIGITKIKLVHARANLELKERIEPEFYQFAQTFNEVYNIIQDKYVDADKLKPAALYQGALEGMFRKLDPHSQYMASDNFSQLTKDTEGKFSGIGVHIGIRDGLLTVISPIPGSPGAKAGLHPWDRIIEIEGETTEDIDIMTAVHKLTGPPGTAVTIKVYRKGEFEPLNFTITRGVIKIEDVYWKVIEDNIGYVRLRKFSANTTRDLKKALVEFKKAKCKGVIVDLRFNTGGLLNEAIETSDLFLDPGKLIVSTKGRSPESNREYKADGRQILETPLIVLVNRGSASASEIFAGAMQDLKRGMIVGPKGEKTFGKGSVQSIEQVLYPFDKDENGNLLPAAVRITTARYYTPSGRTIHEIGITPDVEVELPKGHITDLLVKGLMLGDVALDENVKEDQPPADGADKPVKNEDVSPDESGADEKPSDDAKEKPKFYQRVLNGANAGADGKPVQEIISDIQLLEAIKLMRAMMFANISKAA